MRIKRESVVKNTVSCSFCDKGELTSSGMGLQYQDFEVTTFLRSNGNGMKVSICDDCLDELNMFVNASTNS